MKQKVQKEPHATNAFPVHLLYELAKSVVDVRELAMEAVVEASEILQKVPEWWAAPFPEVLSAVTVRVAAAKRYEAIRNAWMQPFSHRPWTYADFDLFQEPKRPTTSEKLLYRLSIEELDVLLVCRGLGLNVLHSALVLQCTSDEVRRRLTSADTALQRLAVPDGETAVQQLLAYLSASFAARKLKFSIPSVLSLKLKMSKSPLGQRLLERPGFFRALRILLALLAILLALILVLAGIRLIQPQSAREGSRTLKGRPSAAESVPVSLYDLTYRASYVPEGFRRTNHLRSAEKCHALYQNDQGNHLEFTQQLAAEDVVGFDVSEDEGEPVVIRGHTGRLVDKGHGLRQVLWYRDRFCYTISTDLSREEAIAVAQNVVPQVGGYPTLQSVPLEALPYHYSPALAQEYGDVVLAKEIPFDGQRLKSFVQDCAAGKDGSIRITEYADNTAIRIMDLQRLSGRLYFTCDARRDLSSPTPWEVGGEYSDLSLLEQNGNLKLLISNTADADWKEIFAVSVK